MANFGASKTWTDQEVLTHTDLNAAFSNIINNVTSNNINADNIDETDDYTWSGENIFTGTTAVTVLTNAAGSVQTAVTYSWDPADGNQMTDNSSGIGIDFKMPDAADNQDVYASLVAMCIDDTAGGEDGEFSFKVMAAGTNTEKMTLSTNALTVTPPIASAAITASGIIKTDDTTEATSTTDGSLQTDGGLSVAKDGIIGDDLKLLSDSSVLSLGLGSDFTITHDGTTGATLAGNPIVIDSGDALTLDAHTGIFSFKDAGTEVLRITEGNSGDVTIKLVTNAKDLKFSDNGDAVGLTILDAAAGVNVAGALNIGSVAAAGSDTDKFLVLDGSGNVDYRTGAQVLSDIGAASSGSGGAVTGLNNATANELVTVGSTTTELDAEANLTYSSDALLTASSSANLPSVSLTNTHADATAGKLIFTKDPATGQGADNDVMGTIEFFGTDASNNAVEKLAYIDSYVVEADHGSEAAGLRFYVAENDATVTQGLSIVGQASDDGEVDVTIGAGAASTTTIAGTLTMGSTAAMTNAGLLSVANQSGITGLGTISSGTWQGTAIASAYLDSDTAHLSGNQTFTGNKTFTGTLTTGVDDTGVDVKFFGASAGAYMEWDQSADQLRIMGASADATTSTGKLLLATSLTDINANDVLGKIDFQAPHEAGGTDAVAISASIQAIAQDTFSASVNATDLIFYTGHSEAATEKFRFTSQGEIGIGGANYGSDGQVLTSGGAGAAPAWEDAGGGSYSAWSIKTTTYTAASGDQLICNHASTAFTVTLPSSPSAGNTVTIKNVGVATVTIGRNSKDIDSVAADGTLLTDSAVQLVFVDDTFGWVSL
jgi:hypothetical protein